MWTLGPPSPLAPLSFPLLCQLQSPAPAPAEQATAGPIAGSPSPVRAPRVQMGPASPWGQVRPPSKPRGESSGWRGRVLAAQTHPGQGPCHRSPGQAPPALGPARRLQERDPRDKEPLLPPPQTSVSQLKWDDVSVKELIARTWPHDFRGFALGV